VFDKNKLREYLS